MTDTDVIRNRRSALTSHQASILCDEIDRLRAEVDQLDAICARMREDATTVVDDEFGLLVGGPRCEHPSLTGGRCDACGAKP